MGGDILIISSMFITVAVYFYRSMIQSKDAKKEGVPIINESEYLYKMARLSKTSEYEVFEKSAENWSVTPSKIEQDFRKYLDSQSAPYYVSHFIRENKKHVDEIWLPHF